MRLRTAPRRAAASSALLVGSIFAPSGLLAQAQSSITLDLRVDGTGGKHAIADNIGDQILLDLYASPHGLDGDDSNDGISIITAGVQSANGGLKGDLLGLEPPSPFDSNGWSTGAQNDLDGDGDLDIGPAAPSDPTTSTGYYCLRDASTGNDTQPPGGYFVGQMLFTVTSLDESSTTINLFKRPFFESILLYIDDAQFAWIDQSNVMIGPDVTIERGTTDGGGPVQYIDGTYDTHLSLTERTAVTPGKSLLLSEGLDLSPTGALDTTTGAGAQFNINDSTSGNDGGSLLGQQMSIATTADGSFTQAGGYSRFQSINVGAASGLNGTLSITGGRLDSGPVNVGAGGTGNFIQSNGSATLASLALAEGSSASTTGGSLLVSGDAQIGQAVMPP